MVTGRIIPTIPPVVPFCHISVYPCSSPVTKSKELHQCKNGMKESAQPIFAANVCLSLNIPSRHIQSTSIRLRPNGCWSFAGGSAVDEFVQWAINSVHNRILVDNRSSLMAQKRVRLPAGNLFTQYSNRCVHFTNHDLLYCRF